MIHAVRARCRVERFARTLSKVVRKGALQAIIRYLG